MLRVVGVDTSGRRRLAVVEDHVCLLEERFGGVEHGICAVPDGAPAGCFPGQPVDWHRHAVVQTVHDFHRAELEAFPLERFADKLLYVEECVESRFAIGKNGTALHAVEQTEPH